MAGAPQGYIGRNPGDGRTVINRQTSHVTTGVQTSFTMNSGYEVGFLDVYLNGIKQTETLDFTASDGVTINFSPSFAPMNGDVLEFVAFETLNITNIKSARRNFAVGRDLTVDGSVTIGSSLTVATDLVVNGTFTTINTEILDVEDKTVGIASTSSPSNTTADGAGIVIYGGSDGDKSITWNSTKSNFVVVGGGVSIGTGVTISTPAANVLAFSVNSAEKARFNNFGAFTVGYEGEAWHESTYVGVLQAGSGAWIGQTPGAGARAEWVNNAYYDSVNTRWEYIAADEANRIYLENGELHLQSAAAGSADGLITWNERLAMTVGGDFKIGPNAGIGITISSSGNVDAIGIVTASSFDGNLNASQLASGTVPTARLGSGTANNTTFLRGDSTFAVVNTDLVSDTSPQLGGALDTNGNNITFGDSGSGSDDRLTFGASEDLQIYHDGSHSRIVDEGTGYLTIQSSRLQINNAGNSENMAAFIENGAVELYHNNSKKVETRSDGLQVDGTVRLPADNSKLLFGAGLDLEIYHSGTHSIIKDAGTGNLQIAGSLVQITNAAISASGLVFNEGGSLELYHDGTKKFETTSTGATLSGNLSIDANVIHNGDTNTMLSFSAADQIDLITNSTVRARFSNNGLALGNNMRLDILDASGHRSGVIDNSDSGANSLRISADPDNSGSNTAMIFFIDGSEKARVDSSGKLLVGTTNTGSSGADNLVLYRNGNGGITVRNNANQNGNLFFSRGTSGADEYRGYIQYQHASDYMAFGTNGAERFSIGATGVLSVRSDINGQAIHQFMNRATNSGSSAMTNEIHFNFARSNDSSMNLSGARIIAGKEGEWVGAASNQDGYLAFHTCRDESPTEKVRIASNGDFMVGTQSSSSSTQAKGISLNNDGAMISRRDGVMHYYKSISTGGYYAMQFLSANTGVGSIFFNSGGTQFNTSSDYRRKENVVSLINGISKLKQLKPYRFNFIDNPSETIDGFLAHEAQEIIPHAVTGTKDQVATAEDISMGNAQNIGDPMYQQMDLSKLVPLLTAALQEAVAKIETLETENTDLKNLIKNSSSFAALKSSL